jgi:FkbM family methyltransferase
MQADAATTAPSSFVQFLLLLGRHTLMGRGKARRQLLKTIEKHNPDGFVTEIRGCPFTIRFDNETERKALFNNYNLRELAFLQEATRAPNSVFVDVGANCGYYSMLVGARMGPGSTVIGIEPSETMTSRFQTNQALLSAKSDTAPRFLLAQCALGTENGTATLFVPEGPNGHGTASITDTGTGIDVPIRRLPDLLKENGIERIDALKIDVEGYEDRALLPLFEADRALWPKAIVIEHTSGDDWETDILRHMLSIGYYEQSRTRSNAMLRLAD